MLMEGEAIINFKMLWTWWGSGLTSGGLSGM
jgi:hypothetical protein